MKITIFFLSVLFLIFPLQLYTMLEFTGLKKQEGRVDWLRPGSRERNSEWRSWPVFGWCGPYISYLYVLFILAHFLPEPSTWLTRSLELYFMTQYMDPESYQNVAKYLALAMKPHKAITQKNFTLVKVSIAEAFLYIGTA